MHTSVAMLTMVFATAAWAADTRVLEWKELIPADAPQRFVSAPVPEGQSSLLPEYGAAIVEELDGEVIRIPGFIVPLESDEGGLITEFFLVPYFGACIHVPPPPPNQLIYVTLEEAYNLESMWDAFWIEGTLRAKGFDTDLGAAGYTLEADKVEKYEF